jgi:dTDP-glucose 4,6-dehydratase
VSKIVITGGSGFIGSHVAERVRKEFPDSKIVILDKMTYAADIDNISHLLDRHATRLVVGDVCDLNLCRDVLYGADLLIHLAAESHVDNSFGDSLLFTKTNALGTHTLLEACRINEVPKIIHISTDEVYGEVLVGEVDETEVLSPTNPYSASKACAEMLVMGYMKSFKLPVIKIRANNIIGIRQYPEKLVPRCCLSLIRGEKIPMHGDGKYIRHYLAVEDFVDSLMLLLNKGIIGEAYNIGSNEEYTNLEIATMICQEFGSILEDSMEFVADRPFNDQRYSVSVAKIEALGWKTRRSLKDEIPKLVEWYKANEYRYNSF